MSNPSRRFLLGAAIALALAGAARASAQEMQVPLDRDGRVEVVDAGLAARAGLWLAEYPGFREARLFRTPGGGLVLEITEEREGRVLRHREPATAAEVDALRARISAALAAGGADFSGGVPDQTGRNVLIGQTTLAGLTYYGWALPYALNVGDPATAGGLYLLTAAASFFVPFALTDDQPVTRAMADLSRYGVTRGILHGLLLGDLLDGGVGDGTCDPTIEVCVRTGSDADGRLRAGLGMALSAGEAVAGYSWAGSERMTAGTAHTIAFGGDVGLVTGLLGTVALGLDDGDGFSTHAALGLAGSALGIYGGHELARRRAYTWGDVQVIYVGTALGGWTGAAAAALADAGEEITAGAAILGGWTGIYITDRLVGGTDFTAGQAGLLGLGTLAGGLAGAGIGVLMSDGDVALVGSSLGAMAGFAVAYRSFTPRSGSPRGVGAGPLTLRVHPEGVAGLLGNGAGGSRPAGLISASYRF